MNDEQYFLMYANYPVIDYREKYISFLKSYNVPSAQGNAYKAYKAGIIQRRFNLDSDEIEKKRHLLFDEILKQIADGKSLSNAIGLDKIIQEVNKTNPTVTYELTIDAKGKEKFARSEAIGYIKSRTRGEYLYILACHSLITFLSVKGSRQKIKRCPYCKMFFIAKDAKRTKCYEKNCVREDERLRKKKQRKDDPVKYT